MRTFRTIPLAEPAGIQALLEKVNALSVEIRNVLGEVPAWYLSNQVWYAIEAELKKAKARGVKP